MTTCLLVLGATLLAAAHIYGWSYRDQVEFDVLSRRQNGLRSDMDRAIRELEMRGVSTDPLIAKFTQDLAAHEALKPGPNALPVLNSGLLKNAATLVKLVPGIALAILLPLGAASCVAPPGEAPEPRAPDRLAEHLLPDSQPPTTEVSDSPSAAAGVAQDLLIGIDGTLSGHPGAFKMVAANLVSHKSRIMSSQRVRQLSVLEFRDNGLIPFVKFTIEVPAFTPPPREGSDAGELGVLPNIEEGLRQYDQEQYEQALTRSRLEYDSRLSQVLGELTEDRLLPSAGAEPQCTDLNGFLRFLTTGSGVRPRLAVALTDGAETCAKTLEEFTLPADLTLVIVVLPLDPTEVQGDYGLDTAYQDRIKALSGAVKGAHVVPYNTDLYRAILEAQEKRGPAAGSQARRF